MIVYLDWRKSTSASVCFLILSTASLCFLLSSASSSSLCCFISLKVGLSGKTELILPASPDLSLDKHFCSLIIVLIKHTCCYGAFSPLRKAHTCGPQQTPGRAGVRDNTVLSQLSSQDLELLRAQRERNREYETLHFNSVVKMSHWENYDFDKRLNNEPKLQRQFSEILLVNEDILWNKIMK